MLNSRWLHSETSFIENFYGSCVPYSEEACKAAGQNLGLTVGVHFTSGPATTKGCYAYSSKGQALAGKVFYGKDGSDSDMAAPVNQASGQFRPLGYDCKSTNYLPNNTNNIFYQRISFNKF